MSELNRWYVYLHELHGTIVYVGLGTNDRFISKVKRSKEHLTEWDNLTKYKVVEKLSKDEAHSIEQDFLDKHFDSGALYNVKRNSERVKKILYSDVSKHFVYDENSPSKLSHTCDKYCGEYGSVKVASAGEPAGHLNGIGYYVASMFNKSFLAHRLVYCLALKTDLPPDLVVDHIDRDKLNNVISNLRLVSRSGNSRNKKHKETNTGYQSITDFKNKQYFSVGYRENYKSYRICFSYNPRPSKTSRNHHPTREAALEAALEYRNKLVDDGLIILTGK